MGTKSQVRRINMYVEKLTSKVLGVKHKQI